MRVGIATDHGGFALKEELAARLRAAGHEVVDFGAHALTPGDDYPDFVMPLARAVAAGKVERGVAVCGSGVGACGLRQQDPGRPRRADPRPFLGPARGRGRSHEHHLHGRPDRSGPSVAWDLVETFLAAEFSQAERHLRRLAQSGGAGSRRTNSNPDEPIP